MGSPLEALLVIPMALLIIGVVFLAVTFQNALGFGENSLGTSGFDNIQPQMKQTRYDSRGQFNTTLKTVSRDTITIKEIRLTDKIEDEECTIQKTTRKTNLKYWETINITAMCPRKIQQDLYTLSAHIKYTTKNNSKTLIEESGDIIGNVEDQ
jgi:hypothetical protein